MRDHKSLKAWQLANAIANYSLDLARDHWKPHLREVFGQLTRAALSVQINISEGYGLGSSKQFVRHLRIAHGSLLEAGDLVDLLAMRREIPAESAATCQGWCMLCRGMLLGLLRRYQEPT